MSDEHLATPMPVDAHNAHAAAAPRAGSDTTVAWLALLAYVSVYLALRLAEHGGLERDEAEMIYLARELRLGYGTQPPLYTWLQWLAFQAFGPDRFALAIVKDLSLGAIYLAMFRAARAWLGAPGALAAAAALVLFPQIGWEAVRIQTHSVLMIALACGLLWAYAALLGKPSAGRYAGFGLVAGLGLLAKYNLGILLAGVIGASLLVREHRAVLWRRRAWIVHLVAFLVALLVVLPHAAWIVQHPDAAFAGTLHKMGEGGEHASYLRRVLQGALGLASSTLAFVALPGIVFACAAWSLRRRLAFDTRAPASRFFLWMAAICFAQLAVLVLLGVVGTVKERWLMPVLFSLPLGLLVLVPGLRGADVGRRILRIAAVVAVATLALLPARTRLGPVFGKAVAAHFPYAPLAQALQARYPAARTVVASDVMLAGNLLFVQPTPPPLRTVLLDDALRMHLPMRGQVLLVTQEGGEPGRGLDFRSAYPTARLLSEGRIVLPMQLGGRGVLGFTVQCLQIGTPAGPGQAAQPPP